MAGGGGTALEGWLDILTDYGPRRVYGQVQILWGTPERQAEFLRAL